jgi:hypothetical protein
MHRFRVFFIKSLLLTPKFGKEYDMWVRFGKESVWWKERYFQRFSAEGSAVGYLLQFGKGVGAEYGPDTNQ